MPPHKKPKSLQKISLKIVATLVLDACTNIEDKYGSVDEEICLCKLTNLQGYLLSKIQPLFDDLCEMVLKTYFCREKLNTSSLIRNRKLKDCEIFLMVIISEKTKKLNLRSKTHIYDLRCSNNEIFWKCQITKLSNVVKLDIIQITLTDDIFEKISHICKNLREICVTCNLEFTSRESVFYLLNCKELQKLRIDFVKWYNKTEIVNCIRTFVKTLPKLHFIHFYEMGTVLSTETSLTSLRKVTESCVNRKSLSKIISLCPDLHDVDIDARFSSSSERDDMLKTLAESSLPLEALRMRHFSFTEEMINLLDLKGRNLRTLSLSIGSGSISINDICMIGVTCPFLEDLEIVEVYTIDSLNLFGLPKSRTRTPSTKSRIFVNLKSLLISGNSKWDQKILPRILDHANNLTHLVLTNIFARNTDAMSETINAYPLRELRSLTLVSERYASETSIPTFALRSIQRLVDSCSKLINLELTCALENSAILYLKELKRKIQDENFYLKLSFNHVKYTLNNYNIVDEPGDYMLCDE